MKVSCWACLALAGVGTASAFAPQITTKNVHPRIASGRATAPSSLRVPTQQFMFDQLTSALTEVAKNFGPKKRYVKPKSSNISPLASWERRNSLTIP